MSSDPKHIAFIMDGNGRWAEARHKNRFWGHIRGSEVAQKIVEHCATKTSIDFLTLYAFSTENWSRPFEEISFLFKLLERHLKKKSAYLISNNVRLRVIGNLKQLPESLQSSIQELVSRTAQNTGLTLSLALNYSGRQDLLEKINRHFETSSTPLNEKMLSQLLSQNGSPEPDLIVRTSGEQRLSNFMLWQAAYSEFYFTDVLWPDFTTADFDKALVSFKSRQRRFGSVPSPTLNSNTDSQNNPVDLHKVF